MNENMIFRYLIFDEANENYAMKTIEVETTDKILGFLKKQKKETKHIYDVGFNGQDRNGDFIPVLRYYYFDDNDIYCSIDYMLGEEWGINAFDITTNIDILIKWEEERIEQIKNSKIQAKKELELHRKEFKLTIEGKTKWIDGYGRMYLEDEDKDVEITREMINEKVREILPEFIVDYDRKIKYSIIEDNEDKVLLDEVEMLRELGYDAYVVEVTDELYITNETIGIENFMEKYLLIKEN